MPYGDGKSVVQWIEGEGCFRQKRFVRCAMEPSPGCQEPNQRKEQRSHSTSFCRPLLR
jgi:hypothetical protein